MIAVDTNVLVDAHREDSSWHVEAEAAVRGLAEGSQAWAVPWPCIHEFLAIVTHPRIYAPPTPAGGPSTRSRRGWSRRRSCCSWKGSGTGYHLRELTMRGKATGARVHDARVAALCRYHRVSELWTVDRDFQRFPGVRVRNPLAG